MSYEKVKQAKHLSIGLKQTMKAIEQEMVKEIFIAKDADKRLTSKIIKHGNKNHITIHYVDSMKQLGLACGIDVGASTVAVLRDN